MTSDETLRKLRKIRVRKSASLDILLMEIWDSVFLDLTETEANAASLWIRQKVIDEAKDGWPKTSG